MAASAEAEYLRRELLDRYGPMIGGKNLQKALGYQSMGAFRQALNRGRLPVPVFALERRRGKFALTTDVIDWLEATRRKAIDEASALAVLRRSKAMK